MGIVLFYIKAFGDRGLRIQFGNTISIETNQRIRSFVICLENEQIEGIIEWIPTYTAVTIYYDPYKITYDKLKQKMIMLEDKLSDVDIPAAKIIHIPTYYGEEFGPDLQAVAKHNGLDEQEVVAIHSSGTYLVYMIGFTPGFPYLGGMSNKIATPRLAVPRTKIAAGSVGIAGEQTGIYPMETPGGWQLIGRTPLRLYDPMKETPILLEAGNYLKFIPISMEEYKAIEQQVIAGVFEPETENYQDGGTEDEISG